MQGDNFSIQKLDILNANELRGLLISNQKPEIRKFLMDPRFALSINKETNKKEFLPESLLTLRDFDEENQGLPFLRIFKNQKPNEKPVATTERNPCQRAIDFKDN